MFSPFNLCIFEPLDNNGYEAVYFKNTFKDESKGLVIRGDGPKLLPHGVSGFGNHPISEPYKKTELGIDTFTYDGKSHLVFECPLRYMFFLWGEGVNWNKN